VRDHGRVVGSELCLEVPDVDRSTLVCGVRGVSVPPTVSDDALVLVIPFCLSIIESMSMNKLLQEIDKIVWDDVDEVSKVDALQRLMYQWGACMDNKTEEMFGDDDAHITKRKY